MALNIKDGQGNNVALKSKDCGSGEIVTYTCNCPSGSIDGYYSNFASDPADSNNENANKDYSVTPASFEIKPSATQIFYLSRLIAFIKDGGTFDSGSYGNGITLTNGLVIKVYRDGVERINLTNSQPIKTNTDWSKFCYDTLLSNYGAGDETLSVRWTFSKSGTFLKLDGSENDKICVELNDNFAGLTEHTFLFQGFVENI
jgi:hypothetical protein